MANKPKTTRFAFATLLTDLATNTTLGTSTRHDFAAITIYVPELTRTIVNAWARVTFTSADPAVAVDIDAVRIGAKVGAAAFVDVDTTYSQAHTGEAETFVGSLDFTANLVTNLGAGASVALQVGVVVATGAVSAVRAVTCEVFITYECDETAATQIKTIAFALQSDLTDLSATFAEVGSAGTGAAPANQIPQLTGVGGLLKESGIVIRDRYIIATAHSFPGASTVDAAMELRLDGVTVLTRATYEAILSTSVLVYDIVDQSLMPGAGAASAFEARSTVADRFYGTGGWYVVTYEYDPAASTEFTNQAFIPLENANAEFAPNSDATTNNQRFQARIDIQEPGPITMLQTGVQLFVHSQGVPIRTFGATSQTGRPYQGTASQVHESNEWIVHRVDHSGSDWALARGENILSLDYQNNNSAGQPISGFVGFVYSSGKAATASGGHASHNRTLWYHQVARNGTPAAYANPTPTPPSIPESVWKISGVMGIVEQRSNALNLGYGCRRLAGEHNGSGQYYADQGPSNMSAEVGMKMHAFPCSRWFRDASYKTHAQHGADIEASRSWRIDIGGGTSSYSSVLGVTYHSLSFTVAGTVTISGSPAANGKTVQIWAINTDGSADLVGSPVTAGGLGGFTLEVPDDARTYFATYKDGTSLGRSDDANPESGTFDITIGGGSGGYSRGRVVNI